MIPEPINSTVARIYAEWEKAQDPARTYLGASVIGQSCDRALWYGFRWAYPAKFEGRILRLFNRGKREEDLVFHELESISVEVHSHDPQTNKQIRFIECDGHFGGSVDALIRGLPEAPKAWHVLEVKTHCDKSFADLKKNGVEKSKPQHYSQMQCYMGGLNIKDAAYFAVNKNTDEIYFERIKFCKSDYTALIQRAKEITFGNGIPDKLSESPMYYECKMCSYQGICHLDEPIAKNCRTCRSSEPVADGKWKCHEHGQMLDEFEPCKDWQSLLNDKPHGTPI